MCGGLRQQGFLAPCKPEALSLCLPLSLRRLGGRVWAAHLYLGVWAAHLYLGVWAHLGGWATNWALLSQIRTSVHSMRGGFRQQGFRVGKRRKRFSASINIIPTIIGRMCPMAICTYVIGRAFVLRRLGGHSYLGDWAAICI